MKKQYILNINELNKRFHDDLIMKKYTQKQNKNDLNLHFTFDYDDYMCEQLFDVEQLFDDRCDKIREFIDKKIDMFDKCDNDDTLFNVISIDRENNTMNINAINNVVLFDFDDDVIEITLNMNVKIIERQNHNVEIEFTHIKSSFEYIENDEIND